MASNTEDIAEVLSKIEQIRRDHSRAEGHLESAKQHRRSVKAAAKEAFGVSTVKELKAIRSEKVAELDTVQKALAKAVKALKVKLEASGNESDD